jgi:hypothetical protein
VEVRDVAEESFIQSEGGGGRRKVKEEFNETPKEIKEEEIKEEFVVCCWHCLSS